jgi:hypothetical protein
MSRNGREEGTACLSKAIRRNGGEWGASCDDFRAESDLSRFGVFLTSHVNPGKQNPFFKKFSFNENKPALEITSWDLEALQDRREFKPR